MTPEEKQMLTDFANKIAQTPAPQRDPEAEELIRTRIGSRPDALYLMTQTVLVQNIALEHARQEVEQWKQRAQAAPPPSQSGQGGFLGGGGPGYSQQPQQPAYNVPPPPNQGGGLGGFFGGGGGQGGSGMGSFLRSAGTTAAGVAAGALAFEGVRSIFGGVEHLFGFGNEPRGSGFLGGAPGGETIVNNYYEERPEVSRDIEDRRGFADSGADNLGPDDSVDYESTDVPADDSSSDDDNA